MRHETHFSFTGQYSVSDIYFLSDHIFYPQLKAWRLDDQTENIYRQHVDQ